MAPLVCILLFMIGMLVTAVGMIMAIGKIVTSPDYPNRDLPWFRPGRGWRYWKDLAEGKYDRGFPAGRLSIALIIAGLLIAWVSVGFGFFISSR